jgi:hypothetical protein
MIVIKALENYIFRISTLRFFSLLTIATIIHTGVWYIPNIGVSLVYSSNPFGNALPNPAAETLWWNWLGNFIAWLLGIKSKAFFIAAHFLCSLLFVIITYLFLCRANDGEKTRKAAIMFAALPVSGTIFYWIGKDSVTLLLMSAAFVLSRNVALTFLVGIALGLQHFEQSFVAFGALFLSMLLAREAAGYPITVLIGVVIGKVILLSVVYFNDIPLTLTGGRGYQFFALWQVGVRQFLLRYHYIIWSTLGVGWYFAFRFADLGKDRLAFYVPLALLILLMTIVFDQTRVFAVCSFPLLIHRWMTSDAMLENVSKTECTAVLVATMIIPYVWVWLGVPRLSVLPQDIKYLLHRSFGIFDIPQDPSSWPFR